MPKRQNPYRAKFSKAPLEVQLKTIKKIFKPTDELKQLVNQLFSIDPVISERQDGRVSLLTDREFFVTKKADCSAPTLLIN